MSVVNGEFVILGLPENSPYCIHSADELVSYINEIGFLPLFGNEIPGLSVEERTPAAWWFTDNDKLDPWKWREQIARSGEIAYGKFFEKKAGFISKKWFPFFANFRRDGYDFDALYEDEKAPYRNKVIMDLFETDDSELYSSEIKKAMKGSEEGKNPDQILGMLQMQTYLCICDFRCKRKKSGEEYGWSRTVYSKPEHLWGYEYVTSAYSELPSESYRRIIMHFKEQYPAATAEQITKLIGDGKGFVISDTGSLKMR